MKELETLLKKNVKVTISGGFNLTGDPLEEGERHFQYDKTDTRFDKEYQSIIENVEKRLSFEGNSE